MLKSVQAQCSKSLAAFLYEIFMSMISLESQSYIHWWYMYTICVYTYTYIFKCVYDVWQKRLKTHQNTHQDTPQATDPVETSFKRHTHGHEEKAPRHFSPLWSNPRPGVTLPGGNITTRGSCVGLWKHNLTSVGSEGGFILKRNLQTDTCRTATGGLAKLVSHTLVFLSRGSNPSGEFVDGTICVCFILVDWHWVVKCSRIPHKGRVLFSSRCPS